MARPIAPTLQQMRLFSAVAKEKSITRAAAVVNLTQPSVSMQVRSLEEKVGAKLTEQIGKQLHLTAAGELVYTACRDVLDRIEEMQIDLANQSGAITGPLNVAVVSSAKYFLPQLLGSFTRRYPQVEPRLQITNRDTLLTRLSSNEDDLYIMGSIPETYPVVKQPFLENVIAVVARPDNVLARETGITLERLSQERLIQRESGSGTRRAVERMFDAQNLPIAQHIELDDNEAIKQGVISGLGIAFLSLHSLRHELAADELTVLDVEGFPMRRRWFAVHREGKHLSNAAQAFLTYLLEEGEDEVTHLLPVSH